MSDTDLPLIGVHPTATDQSMPVVELAREAEARGLASIYLPEHTHVPVGSQEISSEWHMPDRYRHTLDPFIACSFIAASTTLEVGTGVSLVAQHDAIALAKAVATLDFMSGGRVVLGVGFGYNRPEAADHGFAPRDRALVAEETVALMRAIWTNEQAVFEGRYRRVSRLWSWPKPVGEGPPVLLGARPTPTNLDRIVRWADGWIPMGQGPLATPDLESALKELRKRWDDAGRSGAVEVCCFFEPGTREEMARQIERGAELQVQRMQVFLEDRSREEVLPILDRLREIAQAHVVRSRSAAERTEVRRASER